MGVNVTIASESDGTLRDSVPDFLLHFGVDWVDASGTPHSRTEDEYFLHLLNWLRVNHSQAATQLMRKVGFEIARVKYGVNDAEQMP